MSDVEFEENTFASEAIQKRIQESKPKLGPIYTKIFLAVIILCLSVSCIVLFQAFKKPKFDEQAFHNKYEVPLPTTPPPGE